MERYVAVEARARSGSIREASRYGVPHLATRGSLTTPVRCIRIWLCHGLGSGACWRSEADFYNHLTYWAPFVVVGAKD
jgi:hypothetical protein